MNYLTLVNKNNLIKDSYLNQVELVSYHNVLNDEILVEKKALEAYLELKSFLASKDIIIGMDSSYRELSEQQKIIDEFTIKYGNDYVDKFVAPLKTSEHHTGLAIDLCLKIDNKFLIENEDLMKHNDTFLEIHKYLKDFGFILRYPEDKESITGYNYEPWHIRYVGEVPAKIIHENNLCLEEYLNNFGGVLIVNKEKGVTSRDVVNEVSKILGIKKIGHTGTLDPMAEGVLVLTIGRATKLGEVLTSYEKEYIASYKQGILTDTLDITGRVIDTSEIKDIDYKLLYKNFEKTYMQEVPEYSAVKVNGKKLYEYARRGEKIDLPKKEVKIKKIEDLGNNKFRCVVSKGTYIRSLIRDMGESIGLYFTMNSLTRTKQGDFSIEDSYTLEDIKNNNFKILSIREVLKRFRTVIVDKDIEKKILNGGKLKNIYNIDDIVLFKNKNDELLALYKVDDDCLRMYKYLK